MDNYIPVTTIPELKEKYGTDGISAVLRKVATQLPGTEENVSAIELLGIIAADLQMALRNG